MLLFGDGMIAFSMLPLVSSLSDGLDLLDRVTPQVSLPLSPHLLSSSYFPDVNCARPLMCSVSARAIRLGS
uniref:Putative secreted protein n=1 Tax=Panstrongylus lignarius TaxID=156445 RepID=A0A224Y108_9HEMI